MPRSFRGRHRGRHCRPKSNRLPAVVGAFAVATAATGALTVGGAAAHTRDAGADRAASTELGMSRATLLSAAAAGDALALRSQESVERSTQRSRFADSTAAAAEAQRLASAADLDADAADRIARFPAPAVPTWVVPVDVYTFTSDFGPRWGRAHRGVDLAAPVGTPIRAMGEGEVIEATSSGGYGLRTIIRHADGTEVWYCHQSAFEVTGGSVTSGEVIGYVGNTGNSTGPHLHLEVHPAGGDAVDPVPWLTGLGLTL